METISFSEYLLFRSRGRRLRVFPCSTQITRNFPKSSRTHPSAYLTIVPRETLLSRKTRLCSGSSRIRGEDGKLTHCSAWDPAACRAP
jgi:hypothetical protein